MTKLIEHDGNGRITVNTWIALIGLIVLLLSSITSIIAISTNAQSDIENNIDNINKNSNLIDENGDTIVNHAERMVALETHYKHIKESLQRIEKQLGD